MSTSSVLAPRPIDPELAAEIEKQAAWISPRVRELRVDADGRGVRFEVDAEGDEAATRAKVERFVADMVERHRAVPRKVVVRRDRPGRTLVADAFGELLRRGWAVELGCGRVSLRGPALAAVRALDEDTTSIAHALGAVEEAHPSLVPAKLLARCGYFANFPHAVSLVTRLHEDYDQIERFRTSNADATEIVQPPPGALAPFDACLLPAVCYAVYAARERTTLPEGGVAVTSAGRCFRYESRNLVGIERLWEFDMREIVVIGDAETCSRIRARALEAVLDQLERWDLDGCIESANDPFFPAVRAGRAYWQRSGDRKLELRLPVAPGHAIACASFNLHDTFFGSAFRIAAADGAQASSGCAGWGMQRWMLACFAQHGFDPEGWPSWLASRVFR